MIGTGGGVTISTKGSVTIDSDKGVDVLSSDINFKATGSFKVTAKDISMSSSSSIDLKSKSVNVNGGGATVGLSGSKAEISAGLGMTVNGKALVHEEFLTWMTSNAAMFTMTTGLGAPAPLHPKGLGELNTKVAAPGGMKTTGATPGAPPVVVVTPSLPKLHLDKEIYSSV
jgi:hypothetical protein